MAGQTKATPKSRELAKGEGKDALPSFDESALASLTAKIEQGLRRESKPTDGPKNQSSRRGKSTTQGLTADDKIKNKASKNARGTKRDAEGTEKSSPNPKKSRTAIGSQKRGKEDDAMLLQEILALGGTEEDLELVAGAISDNDDDKSLDANHSAKAADRALRKEIASFVAGLGIESNGLDDASEENTEEEVEEDEEDEVKELTTDPPSKVNALQKEKGKGDKTSKIEESRTTYSSNDNPQKGMNRLLFEARPDWHAAELPQLPESKSNDLTAYQGIIANLQDYAKSLLEADTALYASKHLSSSSSHRFLSTIMASGTLSDKISALTLVVQESPVHTMISFDNLLGLAQKRSRGQAVTALGALKDLLGAGVVLPADRRLRHFANQPGLIGALQNNSIRSWKRGQKLPGGITEAHLISWAFEDWLKEAYFRMLKILEGWCNDEVEYARSRAVNYVYELLKEKPEQEANLLRLLVNKLGDPDKKIASRTSYLLLQLQISHPLMKPIIIRSIETEILLRPGQSTHAKYYAINTLNQTILSGREEPVAQKLLSIYFDLFVSLLKSDNIKPDAPVLNRKGQIQGGGGTTGKKANAKKAKEEEAKKASEESTEKLISAVLTGVNRAFPFSKSDEFTLEKHMDTLFKITHSSNFNTSVQALILIEQLATSKHIAVDRFYRTLYESLLDPRLVTSSKHTLYLNLLFKALRSDLNVKRVKAFVKRILQVATLHQPPFICGVLYMLKELETVFPGLRALITDPEEYDIDEEVFRDVPEDVVETSIDAPDSNPKQSTKPSHIYDGRKRDPEHSNADQSCLWESLPFSVHFHPSVSLFASNLLSNDKAPPKPDLASHTLSHFLDKFVYRNAKTSAAAPRGTSIMQPLAGGDNSGVLLSSRTPTTSQQPLNSTSFWRKNVEDVSVEDVFFHKYFTQIGKAKEATSGKKTAKRDGKELESGEDDEDEDEIWQALVESRPEIEGDSEDGSDMEMLDLEDSDISDLESMAGDSELEPGSDEDEVPFIDDGSEESENELFEKESGARESETAEEKNTGSKERRKMLRSLPTFASAEDYEAMLDNDADEDF
ncbi:CBF/Mak21 family-domain-containing protein [Xylogone sp. PMI_703]|nr:CBF/Mak21 family-domain-containing protein [Xylogone sp. PMI_703]